MNWANTVRALFLAASALIAGCGAVAPARSPAVAVNLDTEASAILARIYPPAQLSASLALYQLDRAAIEQEVLVRCSIAYSVVQRTRDNPAQRAAQLAQHHGSAYYLAEENRCAESLIANKVASAQWQRIEAGELRAGELVHLARFDEALTRFNQWAESVCRRDPVYVAQVFHALDQRIQRQRADIALLQRHYRDEKRLTRVLSWHSGRRTADYQTQYRRAELLADGCRRDAVPNYTGLTI